MLHNMPVRKMPVSVNRSTCIQANESIPSLLRVNRLMTSLSAWLLTMGTRASHTICKLMAVNWLHTCNCALEKISLIAGCEPVTAPAAEPVFFGCILAAPAAFFPALFASATHTLVRSSSRAIRFRLRRRRQDETHLSSGLISALEQMALLSSPLAAETTKNPPAELRGLFQ